MMFTKTDTNKAKGIAAMLLVFHHMYYSVDDVHRMCVSSLVFSDTGISNIALCCRIAVYIFVFLSGFGISVGLNDRKSGIKFIVYRFWRLLSPYWFTLLVLNIYYIVWQRCFYYLEFTDSPLFIFGDIIPVLDIIGKSQFMINGIVWYMNLALLIVLISPLIYLLTKRFKILPIVVTVLIYNFIPFDIVSPYGKSYLSYLFALEFGVLFYVCDVFGKVRQIYEGLRKSMRTVLLAILLLLSGLCPYFGWFVITDDLFGSTALLHTFGGISVILLMYLFTEIKPVSVPLEFIGKYSNDIYLTHLFVIFCSMNLLTRVGLVLPQYIVAMGLCVLTACLINLLKKYTGWLKLISTVSKNLVS